MESGWWHGDFEPVVGAVGPVSGAECEGSVGGGSHLGGVPEGMIELYMRALHQDLLPAEVSAMA